MKEVDEQEVLDEVRPSVFDDFEEIEKAYYYNGNKVSKDFTFDDEELESSLTRSQKKTREKIINTFNSQTNSFDSFMYAIKLNAYSDLLRLKNLANQEEYAKLNIKSREPEDSMASSIMPIAFKEVIGNDGPEGIKRLINYIGFIKAYTCGLKAKERDKIRDGINPEDPLRDEKADQLSYSEKSEASALYDSVSSLQMSIDGDISEFYPGWQMELLKHYGINENTTVREYYTLLGKSPEAINQFCRTNNVQPETAMVTTQGANNQPEGMELLASQFFADIMLKWLEEGRNQYINNASEKEKQDVIRGGDLIGQNPDGPHASEETKAWVEGEGKHLIDVNRANSIVKSIKAVRSELGSEKPLNMSHKPVITEIFNSELKDISYLKGAVRMLEETGKGTGTSRKSNSKEYENMLKAVKEYESAVDEARGGKALDLKDKMVRECLTYIKDKFSVRSHEFGKERFDTVMTILMKNMDPNEYEKLILAVNKKRGAKDKENEGFISREHYREKARELEEMVTPSSILDYKDKSEQCKFVGGILRALKEIDTRDREKGIFYRSEEYKNMYNAAVAYDKTLRSGDDSFDLKLALVKAASEYANNNLRTPKNESEQAKLDVAMIINKDVMSEGGFEFLVNRMNSVRKANRPDKKGYIDPKSYDGKKAEIVGRINNEISEEEVVLFREKRPFTLHGTFDNILEKFERIYGIKPIPEKGLYSDEALQSLKDINDKLPSIGRDTALRDHEFLAIAYGASAVEASKKNENPGFNEDGFLLNAAAGREKAKQALLEYGKGNKKELAILIKNSIKTINKQVMGSSEFSDHHVVESVYQKNMVNILKKDKELMKLAIREGLGPNDLKTVDNMQAARTLAVNANSASTWIISGDAALDENYKKELVTKLIEKAVLDSSMKASAANGKENKLFNTLHNSKTTDSLKEWVGNYVEKSGIYEKAPTAIIKDIKNEKVVDGIVKELSRIASNPNIKKEIKQIKKQRARQKKNEIIAK
ncbi:MAG: hypothetical protein K6E28_03550 [Eubacterium sp.]|nr:hypothetical protein [Eubacterium sp.]